MIDLHFRATSKRALVKMGRALNFIDSDNNPLPGVDIDSIEKGQLTLKAGTYDGEGNELTAPIHDTTHIHANVRLSGKMAKWDRLENEDQFDRSKIRRWCRANGVTVDVASKRRNVTHVWYSKDFGDGDVIELIWPAPGFPRRIWFGD